MDDIFFCSSDEQCAQYDQGAWAQVTIESAPVCLKRPPPVVPRSKLAWISPRITLPQVVSLVTGNPRLTRGPPLEMAA